MNWLDIVLIIVLIIGFLYGLKTGLIGAAFMAIGVIVGWQFAGHLRPVVRARRPHPHHAP